MRAILLKENLSGGRVALRIALVLILVLATVMVVFPQSSYAYNGYLEDCDGDGYDDETFVPVPWRGYDQTWGDPNPVPADWDGVAGSYDPNGTAGHKKSSNTGTADSTTASSNTGNTGSSNASSGNNAASTNSGSASQTPATILEDAVPLSELSEEVAAIVGTRGKLSVKPVKADVAYTPGAQIVIKGESFAGNVDELDIEIRSENPRKLYTVSSKEDGSFEAKVNLPKDIELGIHNIVILYQGNPIVKTTIEVVESAVKADAEATEKSGGINFTGIILLAALVIIAAGALLGWKASKSRKARAQ